MLASADALLVGVAAQHQLLDRRGVERDDAGHGAHGDHVLGAQRAADLLGELLHPDRAGARQVVGGDLDGGVVEEDHALRAQRVPVEVPGLLVEADEEVDQLAVAVDPLVAHADLVHAGAALDLGGVGAEGLGPVPAAGRGLGEDVPEEMTPSPDSPASRITTLFRAKVPPCRVARREAATDTGAFRAPDAAIRLPSPTAAPAGAISRPGEATRCYRLLGKGGKIAANGYHVAAPALPTTRAFAPAPTCSGTCATPTPSPAGRCCARSGPSGSSTAGSEPPEAAAGQPEPRLPVVCEPFVANYDRRGAPTRPSPPRASTNCWPAASRWPGGCCAPRPTPS